MSAHRPSVPRCGARSSSPASWSPLALAAGGAVPLLLLHSEWHPFQPDSVEVITTVVERHEAPVRFRAVGTVQASRLATVRSQVAGTFRPITFIEGQTVKKGDVLAELDPGPLQARVAQASADLARDREDLGRSQVALARPTDTSTQPLDSGPVSQDAPAAVELLRKAVEVDGKMLEYAQADLDRATLTAPIDGLALMRSGDVGMTVRSTDANGIVVIERVQPAFIRFSLPTSDLGAVLTETTKQSSSTVVARDRSTGDILDTDRLIDVETPPGSQTTALRARFPNAGNRLKPGCFVQADIEAVVAKDTVTLPAAAVHGSGGDAFVYVVGFDRLVDVHPVAVGGRQASPVAISSGLAQGESVVVDACRSIKPETRVKPTPFSASNARVQVR